MRHNVYSFERTKNMNILVIGGTGLIGQYLVRRLLDLGHVVHVLTRDVRKVVPAHSLLSPIIGDISKADWIEKSKINLALYHVVYHLAYAVTEDESYNRRVTFESVKMLLSNLERLRKIALQHFVYVGSVSVFGMVPKDAIVSESSEKKADSAYALNKIEASRLVLNSSAEFLTTVLHPTCVYDAQSNRINSYQDMLRSNYIVTLSGGMGKNNIVHADDVASALVDCLHRLKTNKSEEYLINGETIVYKNWFRSIEKTIGVENKRLAPKIFRPLYRGVVRQFLNRMGFRCPAFLPHYKLLIYENNAVCSSQKAIRDFSYLPARKFKDVCDQICIANRGSLC